MIFCFIFLFIRNTFRQNLVSGDKSVVFPILQWLLEKVPEHKERAYLGRYLSKIDVPSEFLSDPEIAEHYERVKFNKIFLYILLIIYLFFFSMMN